MSGHESSAELLTSASHGDALAVERLLERNLPRLRAFIRLRTGEKIRANESCSDLVQSVCAQVLKDLPNVAFADETAFRGWLFRAALSKILDRRKYYEREKRHHARVEQAVDPDLAACYATVTSPSGAAQRREDLERLERAFDELQEEHREVVTLHKMVGMSHAAIAAETGRSEGATRMLLHRALARLGVILSR